MTTRWTFGIRTPRISASGSPPVPSTYPTDIPNSDRFNLYRITAKNISPSEQSGKSGGYVGGSGNDVRVGWKSVAGALSDITINSPVTEEPVLGGEGWGYDTSGKWTKIPGWKPQGRKETLTWSDKLQVPGAPDWWKGKVANIVNPETSYAMQMNSMIPYLSPEDQRNVAVSLFEQYPTVFSEYDPNKTKYPNPPAEMNAETRQRFTSQDRTKQALSTLQNMAKATGKGEASFGAGYTFLRTLLKTMQDFSGSGANQQTRAQMVQQMGALSPLNSEAKKYGMEGITSALTNPYFSSGSVAPIIKNANGKYTFGTANSKWY